MKKMEKNKFIFLLLSLLFILMTNQAVGQEDSVKAKELVKLKYFNDNNTTQYLIVETLLKKGKKTEPRKNKLLQLYLDSNNAENLIAKVTTDKEGNAKSFLPPVLKTAWDAKPTHTFIAVENGKEDEVAAELEITKAKMEIDTSSEEGVRSVTVKVMKYQNSEWVPANEVEMKIGVQRLGGILSAGDEESYSTDSSGIIKVEFKKDSLPGDEKGNFLLVAKAEDNDQFGNLLASKTVNWGVALTQSNGFFNQRTLWSTRFKTPIWLLFMAYSIVIGVWGTIIYLIFQIIKIKKIDTLVSL